MRYPLLLGAACLLGAGCTSVIPDPREDAYDYHLESSVGDLAFHWPIDSMPLKIWVDPAGPLYGPTKIAIARWEGALLYHEFRGQIVADSFTANVIIHNTSPFGVGNLTLLASALPCKGETDFNVDADSKTLSLPVPVYVYSTGNLSADALATCYRVATTHELGHALGILSHSPNPNDVMYFNPVLDGLSIADRETMELVYHSTANLTAVRDPFLRAIHAAFHF